MRRITTLAVLALSSSFVMAQGGPPPHEQGPEGYLFNSLGGEKVTKQTGIVFDGYMQLGTGTNNTILKGAGGDPTGDADGPIPGIADVDTVSFEQIEVMLHKEIKSNFIIGVTPTPAPMTKKFDWGFMADTDYGRTTAQGCRMTGFDFNWAMNNGTMKSTDDPYNRNLWLCEPQLTLDLYFPVLKGVAVRLGRQPDQLMTDEVPPNFRMAPNFFYTHNYGFYRVTQVFGGRVDAVILHDHKLGYLLGEFFVDNGLGTVYSMSKKFNYEYALRYRSPDMSLSVDYTGRAGFGNVKTDATGLIPEPKAIWVEDNFTNYHLFSPNAQKMFENQLLIQKEFRPHWKVLAQIQFGKQQGDGNSNTILALDPGYFAGVDYKTQFKGASFLSFKGESIYTFNKKYSAGLRLEEFRNPQGFFTPMFMSQISGTINDFTAGVNYNVNKFVRIRPELRYDWQSGKYGDWNGYYYGNQAFGNAHKSDTQFSASVDAVFYF